MGLKKTYESLFSGDAQISENSDGNLQIGDDLSLQGGFNPRLISDTGLRIDIGQGPGRSDETIVIRENGSIEIPGEVDGNLNVPEGKALKKASGGGNILLLDENTNNTPYIDFGRGNKGTEVPQSEINGHAVLYGHQTGGNSSQLHARMLDSGNVRVIAQE